MENNEGFIDGRSITDEGAHNLQMAIISQAVRDWKSLLTMKRRGKDTYEGKKPPFAFKEIRRFFKHGGYGLLECSPIDGEIILMQLEKLLQECDESAAEGIEN